jgi:PhnB protein
MSSERSYIQKGYYAITPYLNGGIGLVDFIRNVFAAEVTHPPQPDASGNFHAELKIADSMLLVGSGYFTDPAMSAATWVYVPDCDATYRRALAAGAKSVREPADQSWGDRVAGVSDGFRNTWWIATHKGRN